MSLSLIVVHYRSLPALERLLDSLRASRPAPLEEILIVNNSGEPVENAVAGLPWRVRILNPGRNLGYARGVNEGIRAAREDAILILNPDILVSPGSIEALVRCAEAHPRAGIVAPRLLNADGTLQLSARRFYNWKTLLLRRAPLGPYAARSRTLRDHLMADWDHTSTRAVDWVLGAAMLARKRAIRDVGMMDERYFLYFEDVDWCQRMWRHGYEVLYCADSSMVHEYARQSAQLRARSIRAHAAGLLRFAEKWSALLYAVSQYRQRLGTLLALGTDVAAAALAFLAAYGIRTSLASILKKPVSSLPSYSGLLFFTVVVTVAALAANGLYRRGAFTDSIERAFRLGQSVIQAVLFLMASTFLFQTPRYSRVLVLLVAPILYAILLLTRGLVGRLGEGARRQGFAFRRVLVVGSGREAERVREAFEHARRDGFEPLATVLPAATDASPEAAAARLRALVESERIQIVCVAPEPQEVPYLLAAASALRDSGAATYWTGSVAQLASEGNLASLGGVRAVLLHAPSRGLSVRVRKRASDLLLSLFVAPFRWGALRAYLARRGEGYGPGEAWGRVWTGRLSWVGRSAYETDRWENVPGWARLALESIRPGVVTPPDGVSGDPMDRVTADLAYLSRFSLAEDLRQFLRATRGNLSILILCLALAACAGRAGARTTLYVKNYVNSNEVQSVTSWNGRVTLGTLGGIVTIDPENGTIQKILRTPSGGLPSNHVLTVAVSPSGLLWAGTAESGIARLRPDGSFRRALSSFDGLPSDRVQALHVHGDSVWVGTGGGVALFTENTGGQIGLTRSFTNAGTSGALAGDDVRAFAQFGDTLWVATTSGLSAFASGAWSNRSSALAGIATSLVVFGDTLWAATDQGPYRYAAGIFQAANAGHLFASNVLGVSGSRLYSGSAALGALRYAPPLGWVAAGGGLPSPRVTSFATGPDAAFWAGTVGGAARLSSGGTAWEPFLSDGPLVNGTQRAVTDRRGVWFTTGNAFPAGAARGVVLHFDGSSWSALTSVTTAGAFQEADAFAILSAADARLWIGHCCADAPARPRIDRYDPATGIWDLPPAYNIWAMAQAPSGLVYAAGVEHENGVYVFDPGTGALLDSLTPGNSGITSNNLSAAKFDTAGKGWFGSAFNGLDVWDGRGTPAHGDDAWVHYAVNPSNQVTSIAVLSPQAAWIGTTFGAGLIQNGVFTRVLTNPSLPSGQVADLALDSGGNVWIGTSAGLVRTDASGAGSPEVFTTDDGLVDNDVRALAWDPERGVLWVGTANGVSRVVAGAAGDPAITAGTYVYPNPARAAGTLKLGGIQNALTGEIRDVSGTVLHRFRCDPAANEIWDLRTAKGDPAPSGIYLIVLRDLSGGEKTLRAAVVR